MTELRVGLLYAAYGNRASYYSDWQDAFMAVPEFKATGHNIANITGRADFKRNLAGYDAIVLLHSVLADNLYFFEKLMPLLMARRGSLLAFIGNEYNHLASPMADRRRLLAAVGVDYVASQLPIAAAEYLYGDIVRRRVLALPHALNPAVFTPGDKLAARRVDIGCRSFRYPAFLGDDDRNRMMDKMRQLDDATLVVDINNQQRFGRADWAQFLQGCKTQIATEAGAVYVEKDDATLRAIMGFIAGQQKKPIVAPNSLPHRLARLLPWGVKQQILKLRRFLPVQLGWAADDDGLAAAIQARFFAGKSWPVSGKCISSRHFDAIGCRSVQIMFEGEFNGILRAGEHYLALAPDFSNLDNVLEQLRDVEQMQRMADQVLEYVMAEHSYAVRMRQLVGAVTNSH